MRFVWVISDTETSDLYGISVSLSYIQDSLDMLEVADNLLGPTLLEEKLCF